VLFAVGFGLLAAFAFAASASLQQHAAHEEPPPKNVDADADGRLTRRTAIFGALWQLIRRLIRSPLWLVGWVTNLLGFAIQAVALQFGSIALVQPLLVTQLLFALPLASAWHHRWPVLRDWFSAMVIVAGLVVFLAVRDVSPLADKPDRVKLILGCFAAAGAVVVLVLVAAGMPIAVRATIIAVAAGVCFAVSAAMIKLTSDDLIHRGVVATARDWPGYTLAASTVAGLLLEQGAFAAGSLPAAVAAMSVTNPIVSYLLGVFAFGVAAPTTVSALAGLAGAGALICVGAVGLAHSPIVRSDSPDVSVKTVGEYREIRVAR
jgi:drug/metabolite transporter (DMT)-like permease